MLGHSVQLWIEAEWFYRAWSIASIRTCLGFSTSVSGGEDLSSVLMMPKNGVERRQISFALMGFLRAEVVVVVVHKGRPLVGLFSIWKIHEG